MAEYIDRQAVLWDLHHIWDWDSVDGITASTVLKQVITDVKNVPAADVRENVKGEWISHKIGHENVPFGFDCTACGAWFVVNGDTRKRYAFCPNCGADMRGEKDGE